MGAKVGKGEEYGFILRFYNKGLRILRHVLRQLIVKTMEKSRKKAKNMVSFCKNDTDVNETVKRREIWFHNLKFSP